MAKRLEELSGILNVEDAERSSIGDLYGALTEDRTPYQMLDETYLLFLKKIGELFDGCEPTLFEDGLNRGENVYSFDMRNGDYSIYCKAKKNIGKNGKMSENQERKISRHVVLRYEDKYLRIRKDELDGKYYFALETPKEGEKLEGAGNFNTEHLKNEQYDTFRKIIEDFLRVLKLEEIKNLAAEMEMNFDENLYTQLENLKDSEMNILTKFLLRWLIYPERSDVPHDYPQVSDIAEKITNNKYFKSHIKVAGMFLNFSKYPVFNFVDGDVDSSALRRLSNNIDGGVRSVIKLENIKKFKVDEMRDLLKFLKMWLNQTKINVSNMSKEVLEIFSNITKYEDFEKYRKFVKELFRRGILDKKYVVDAFRDKPEKLKNNDSTEYKFLKSYQCRPVAGTYGQFKGVVFKMPDGCIYRISADEDLKRSGLIDLLVSLGFEN